MVNSLGRNKSGWVRILEATIAVMIVSGVMIAVYSQQTKKVQSSSEYFYDLQRQILTGISSRGDLRLNVLNTVVDNVNDSNFSVVNDFVKSEIPLTLGYFLRICELDNNEDFCKMNTQTYITTKDKNVYVADIVISSDLGNDTIEKVYNPKKVRLFVWRK